MPDDKNTIAGAVTTPLRHRFFLVRFASGWVVCLLLIVLSIGLIGCGGGTGGDGDSSDPLGPEINARVDGLLNAISSEDLDGVMAYIDGSVKWYHADSIWNHEDIKRNLQAFFAAASNISLQVDTREVVSNLETFALFAGRLSGTWVDGDGVTRELQVENIEIQWSREPSNWGILSFSGHAGAGSQFPPVL